MPLTAEQKDIVESFGKPMLVMAGPGTGKTKVLAHKITHLLRRNLASKEEIIGITFTTKAAGEMRNRLAELGLSMEEQPLICTLHSFCVRMLKDKGDEVGVPKEFLIADEYESSLVLSDSILDVNLKASEEKIRKCSKDILLLKARGEGPNDIADSSFRNIYSRYQKLLRFHCALDFQDLILKGYALLERCVDVKNYYKGMSKSLLVDEFQDINRAEYSLIRLLANEGTGLFIVGDDKQSIYGWRGGNPEIILGVAKDFAGVIEKPMTICFRCPEKVIRGADEFIKRKPCLKPFKKNGEPIKVLDCKSDVQEAKYISEWVKGAIQNSQYSAKDIAILYQGGDIADRIAENLREANIPITRPSPKEVRRVKEFIACLRLIVDRRDSLALRVCLSSKLARGIGTKGIKKIRDYAERNRYSMWKALIAAQNDGSFKNWHKGLDRFNQLVEDLSAAASKRTLSGLLHEVAGALVYESEPRILEMIKRSEDAPSDLSLYDFIQEIRGMKGEKSAETRSSAEEEVDAVFFVTMHSVKGLQRKVIFVVGMERGNFPRSSRGSEEERRLCYVALTRAEEEIFLCYAKKREGKSAQGYRFYDKSPFIFEIPKQYREFILPT